MSSLVTKDDWKFYLACRYPGAPSSTVYEKIVASYFGSNFRAVHNVKVLGTWSTANRQLDVWLARKDDPGDLVSFVECKDTKKKADIQVIDSMVGKMWDVGVTEAHLVSPVGFSKNACEYAAKVGITLTVIEHSKGLLENWYTSSETDTCLECTWADDEDRPPWIDWDLRDSIELPVFGACFACGTEHYCCPFCDSKTAVTWGQTVQCDGCGSVYAIQETTGEIKEGRTFQCLLISHLEAQILAAVKSEKYPLQDVEGTSGILDAGCRPNYSDFAIKYAVRRLVTNGFLDLKGNLISRSEDYDDLIDEWTLGESLSHL